MLGPIFVTIIQTSIEKGSRAGMTASLGVWISDVLFVLVCYFFIQKVNSIVEDAAFTYWMGLLGGFILIAFGLGSFFKKTNIKFEEKTNHSTNDYIGFWTKGFLVNTINPFTFIFWIGIISTYVLSKKINNTEALVFFTTIILIIMITDTLKVVLAKVIRKRLNEKLFNTFSKVAGIGLIIFGISLLVRSQVF